MIRRPPRSTPGTRRRQRQMCIRDSIKADLKCVTGGAGNIVKYAKKALTKQGGEAVVFEIPTHDAKYYAALTEARRKCTGKIFFYIVDEMVLKELKI